ncbi:pep a2 [Streptomyces sp. NPDC102360]|uniref:pep a2 n=1 Tax=Streptomyces sp. NPDC102360 TaxID=3366160 RepID=UPI00381FB94E
MHQSTPRYYHIAVEPTPERVGQIQRIVAAHTRYWGLERLAPSATRGLGLLLGLAVQGHPGSDSNIEIEAWWNGQHLFNAVSYEDPTAKPARGLPQHCSAQIAALSDGWGSCTQDVRRIVWFSLRSRTGVREILVPKHPVPDASEALHLPLSALPCPAPESVPVEAGTAS